MIEIHEKFKPLFYPKTRYFLITGDRGTSKSFTVGLFLTRLTGLNNNQNVLFTRFTLESAKDSIIPEFREKIELQNMDSYFDVQTRDIYATKTNSRILFRGIKTSQGIQTAKLKSLTGINIWVVDEAEELPDETTFETINKSIRVKGVPNMIILILNPAYKNHWIYKRFYQKIEPGFNGIKNGVTYIHMEFDDNKHNLDYEYVQEMESLRDEDPEKFKKVMCTAWLDEDDAIVFSSGKLKYYDVIDYSGAQIIAYCDVADQGVDYLAFVIGALIDKKVFVLDVCFTKKDSNYTIPKIISLIQKYNIQAAVFESNAMGLMYTKLLKSQYDGKCRIIAKPNSTQKHSRIIIQADNILDNFYFRKSDPESEYYQFIDQLTSYRNDKKSEHDDAADAIAGLSFQCSLIK